MKKIGLCTCYRVNNYGSVLQAFATQSAIEKLGYDCEQIVYFPKHSFHNLFARINLLFSKIFYSTLIRNYRKKRRRKTLEYINRDIKRVESYSKFRKQYFSKLSTNYNDYKSLCEGTQDYSAVIVGSDQLWLPIGVATNFYNLKFVDDKITKISYATSFGVAKIPYLQRKKYKDFLERFQKIGVREESGKKIIESLGVNGAKVVVDPTLLFNEQEWLNLIPNKENSLGKYIFCYFLGENRHHREYVKEISKELNIIIVAEKHNELYVEADTNFGDFEPESLMPNDFLNLIRNAEYVCTDSFHATVFSIIYHKKFLSFLRFPEGSCESRNTRIIHLLDKLGLKTRLYTSGLSKIDNPINYEIVDRELDSWRKDSWEFLETAFKK